MPERTPALQRFEALYVADPESGCWEWTGARTHGYALFNAFDGGTWRTTLAHRWRWEHEHGPIAPGMQLDHRCRNTACVNPAHLDPVTNRENTLRGVASRRGITPERRVKAVELVTQGCLQSEIAAQFGVADATLSAWRRAAGHAPLKRGRRASPR